MLPIALYPSSGNLKKGLIAAGILFFFAFQVMVWSSDDGFPVMMSLFLVGGGLVSAKVARAYFLPKPSFEADADGFSVMGKPKKPWDEFRGVSVRTVRYGFIPISRIVVVKTGKTILGRRIQITDLYQTGSARDMAAEIEEYARHASRKADLTDAFGQADAILRSKAVPVADRAADRGAVAAPKPAMGRPSFAERLDGPGPIQAQPKLSERLFGRRKVT